MSCEGDQVKMTQEELAASQGPWAQSCPLDEVPEPRSRQAVFHYKTGFLKNEPGTHVAGAVSPIPPTLQEHEAVGQLRVLMCSSMHI